MAKLYIGEQKHGTTALYTPNGAAREYAAVGCNFYNGCPHDCEYCYLKRGVLSHTMGKTEVTLKSCFHEEERALAIFKRECDKHVGYLRGTGIFFSFSTDPMLRETCMLTMYAAKYAMGLNIPVKVLTKCANVPLSVNLLLNDIQKKQRQLLAMGYTLTGRDDMEPNADSNSERIDSMRRMKYLGYKTFASIEPIIDCDSSYRMTKSAVGVCDHFKIGLRSGVGKDYYRREDVLNFIEDVKRVTEGKTTVYWKQSIRKFIGDDSVFQHEGSVDMDYNMFE